MGETETWVAAERVGFRRYVRHPDSPEFTELGAVMDWLVGLGLIKRIGATANDEDSYFEGWGDPWFAVPTDKAETSVGRHFGPMHGEKTKRHQMSVDGSQREDIDQIIVSVYALHDRQQAQVAVELTHGLGIGAYARADLTVSEAAALRDWLDEFVKAYG